MINRRKLEGNLTGLIWIFIIYSISLFLLVSNNYSVAHNIYFTFFNVLFLLFYLLFSTISKKNVWLYFLLEGIIIYISAFFMSDTYPVSTALYPLLLGQAILVINSKRWILISIYFILFLIVSVITVPKVDLLMFFIIFIPLNIIIVSYAFNLNKLALSKIELEKAYDDLEYLTLKNERQRMARDLHDILAQGLTGIKMQLEVIDIYLQNNKTDQAVNIVRKSKEDVSNTLATSRMVIDNLHHLNNGNNIDLHDRIKNQIEKFKVNTRLKFNFQYSSNHTLDNEIVDQLEYIISEILFNIVQHAKANHVRIKVIDNFEKFIITINDDGIGFERKKYKMGHYGLRVMEERTKSINGNLYINTSKDNGTTVVIEVPIYKE